MAKTQQATPQQPGFSIFKPTSWRPGGKKKAKVASLGDESNMYYHPELKRWVEKGKEEEAMKEAAGPPPPPTSGGSQSFTAPAPLAKRSVSQRYVLQSNLSVSSSMNSLQGSLSQADLSTLAKGGLSRESFSGHSSTTPSPPLSSNALGLLPAQSAPPGAPTFFVPAPTSSGSGQTPVNFFVPPKSADDNNTEESPSLAERIVSRSGAPPPAIKTIHEEGDHDQQAVDSPLANGRVLAIGEGLAAASSRESHGNGHHSPELPHDDSLGGTPCRGFGSNVSSFTERPSERRVPSGGQAAAEPIHEAAPTDDQPVAGTQGMTSAFAAHSHLEYGHHAPRTEHYQQAPVPMDSHSQHAGPAVDLNAQHEQPQQPAGEEHHAASDSAVQAHAQEVDVTDSAAAAPADDVDPEGFTAVVTETMAAPADDSAAPLVTTVVGDAVEATSAQSDVYSSYYYQQYAYLYQHAQQQGMSEADAVAYAQYYAHYYAQQYEAQQPAGSVAVAYNGAEQQQLQESADDQTPQLRIAEEAMRQEHAPAAEGGAAAHAAPELDVYAQVDALQQEWDEAAVLAAAEGGAAASADEPEPVYFSDMPMPAVTLPADVAAAALAAGMRCGANRLHAQGAAGLADQQALAATTAAMSSCDGGAPAVALAELAAAPRASLANPLLGSLTHLSSAVSAAAAAARAAVSGTAGPAAGHGAQLPELTEQDFDQILHPGHPNKLDGPMPWELPEHLRLSRQFLSTCATWHRENPDVPYDPRMLLEGWAATQEQAAADAEAAVAGPVTEGQPPPVLTAEATVEEEQQQQQPAAPAAQEGTSYERAWEMSGFGLPAALPPAAMHLPDMAAEQASWQEQPLSPPHADAFEHAHLEEPANLSAEPFAPADQMSVDQAQAAADVHMADAGGTVDMEGMEQASQPASPTPVDEAVENAAALSGAAAATAEEGYGWQVEMVDTGAMDELLAADAAAPMVEVHLAAEPGAQLNEQHQHQHLADTEATVVDEVAASLPEPEAELVVMEEEAAGAAGEGAAEQAAPEEPEQPAAALGLDVDAVVEEAGSGWEAMELDLAAVAGAVFVEQPAAFEALVKEAAAVDAEGAVMVQHPAVEEAPESVADAESVAVASESAAEVVPVKCSAVEEPSADVAGAELEAAGWGDDDALQELLAAAVVQEEAATGAQQSQEAEHAAETFPQHPEPVAATMQAQDDASSFFEQLEQAPADESVAAGMEETVAAAEVSKVVDSVELEEQCGMVVAAEPEAVQESAGVEAAAEQAPTAAAVEAVDADVSDVAALLQRLGASREDLLMLHAALAERLTQAGIEVQSPPKDAHSNSLVSLNPTTPVRPVHLADTNGIADVATPMLVPGPTGKHPASASESSQHTSPTVHESTQTAAAAVDSGSVAVPALQAAADRAALEVQLRAELEVEFTSRLDAAIEAEREAAASYMAVVERERDELVHQLSASREETATARQELGTERGRSTLLQEQLDATREELEGVRGQLDALQGDMDELLLCLGQESHKCGALADALREVGSDPEPIIDAIEAQYLVAEPGSAVPGASPATGDDGDAV